MDKIKNIMFNVYNIYRIKNNNYNSVLFRFDEILDSKKNSINEIQINKINKILLDNNKNINNNTLIKILLILEESQINNINSQLEFINSMQG